MFSSAQSSAEHPDGLVIADAIPETLLNDVEAVFAGRRYQTTGVVAHLLGMTPVHLRRLANAGAIGSVKLTGCHRRFLKEDVLMYLRSKRTCQSSAPFAETELQSRIGAIRSKYASLVNSNPASSKAPRARKQKLQPAITKSRYVGKQRQDN